MLDRQVNYNSLLTGKVFSIIDYLIFLVAFLHDVDVDKRVFIALLNTADILLSVPIREGFKKHVFLSAFCG